jgi:hypothetical protein
LFKPEPFCTRVEGIAASFKEYGVKETSNLLHFSGDYVGNHWVVYGNNISSELLFGGKFELWAYSFNALVNHGWFLYGVYRNYTACDI